ncbi:hypothetical protein BDN72DRAFT_360057 [Pluteus cervinus]|uniref:Uncharacterized protein n=1 Tax=Pluteus cervinus TaxID=181527 RepID=A0ACD3BDA0_9AGAR|nr:hypothetical protein BDN72DRAFT_360057 [Pluteus cervinus]
MSINNAFIVQSLESLERNDQRLEVPALRKRVKSDPCLPARLPSTGFILREAEDLAPKAVLRQLRRSPSPLSDSETDIVPQRERRVSTASIVSTSSLRSLRSTLAGKSSDSTQWREPQPFEVLRAIEQKDLMFLMEIRDKAFPLLLRKTGDATPLLHAMRIGQSHREVAIVLLGAFSRYINHLDDEDMSKPKTKTILKALRTNLKLAIDYGLAKSQSDLTASFLQTLIMSEGDKWVRSQIESVARALRMGTHGQPVATAGATVRRFATKELGKAELIASLEDYIANATFDLLMLGTWYLVLECVPGTPIPPYYFARDDRVYKAFADRLDENKSAIQASCGRRLKWQIRVLRNVLEGRTTTYRRKVELLAGELDEGEGV